MSGMGGMAVSSMPAHSGQPHLALRVQFRLTENLSSGGHYKTDVEVKCDPGYMGDLRNLVSTASLQDVAVYHVADLLRILQKELNLLDKRQPPLDVKDIPCIVFKSLMNFSPNWGAQNDDWKEFEPTPRDPSAFAQTVESTMSAYLLRWSPVAQSGATASSVAVQNCSPRRRPRVSIMDPIPVSLLFPIESFDLISGRRTSLLFYYPGCILPEGVAKARRHCCRTTVYIL